MRGWRVLGSIEHLYFNKNILYLITNGKRYTIYRNISRYYVPPLINTQTFDPYFHALLLAVCMSSLFLMSSVWDTCHALMRDYPVWCYICVFLINEGVLRMNLIGRDVNDCADVCVFFNWGCLYCIFVQNLYH